MQHAPTLAGLHGTMQPVPAPPEACIMLDSPLDTVEAYVAHFSAQDMPVLRHTLRALEAMRTQEDKVNARQIAGVVLNDPLMTVRVLSHQQRHRRQSQNHDITTVDRVIMMMGVGPFLHTFVQGHTLEDHLAPHPRALLGALKVINRARRTSQLARDWAIIRHDIDINEITVAGLLREITEIVCWLFAPALAQRVDALQARDPALRSAAAQQAVFGVRENDILSGLVKAWCLPELLITLLDESNASNPRVRNVLIASNFARHLAHGWHDPALPDDLADISQLLRVSRENLLHRLGAPEDVVQRLGAEASPDETERTRTPPH